MPTGAQLLTSASEAVHGSTTEKTFCSRIRRAMSCVYCAPKSRITMDWVSPDWVSLDWVSLDCVSLDWVSTDEFLKSDDRCKALSLNAGRALLDIGQAASKRSNLRSYDRFGM